MQKLGKRFRRKKIKYNQNHKEYTSGAPRWYVKNIELSKEKSKTFETSSFRVGNSSDISTGKRATRKFIGNLIKADKVENDMYFSFVNESLLKSKTYFSDPIEIWHRINVKKMIPKAFSIRQNIGKL